MAARPAKLTAVAIGTLASARAADHKLGERHLCVIDRTILYVSYRRVDTRVQGLSLS